MSGEKSMDPFSSKNILKIGDAILSQKDIWQCLRLEDELGSESLHLVAIEKPSIPDLKASLLSLRLDDVPIEVIDSPQGGSNSDQPAEAEAASPTTIGSDHDNIWESAVIAQAAPKAGLLSWDRFSDQQGQSRTKYLSETAPQIYDAIWDHIRVADGDQSLKFAQPDHLQHALSALVVGRSSRLFSWDQGAANFELVLESFCLTGYSPEFTSTICDTIRTCGSLFRTLKSFCESKQLRNSSLVALQTAAMHVLHGIELHHLAGQRKSRTVLTLKCSADQYFELLDLLQGIVDIAGSTNSEQQALRLAVRAVDDAWASLVHLRPFLTKLADSLIEPALRSTFQRLALSREEFEKPSESIWLFSALLPDLADAFAGTVECLGSICDLSPFLHQAFPNGWLKNLAHNWHDLLVIQEDAVALEKKSTEHLSGTAHRSTFSTNSTSSNSPDSWPPVPQPFTADFDFFEKQSSNLFSQSPPTSSLQSTLVSLLEGKYSEPQPEVSPLMALQMSLQPHLEVQHRLSSYRLMRVLFLQHNLVEHLNLLGSFQLLGDGLFAARMSRALFDTEEKSGEGQRRAGLTTGLRLEDREAWPPASSELRLALMGLLSTGPQANNKDVLNSISFAIRDLGEEEIEVCRYVHSIHALDFLRLVYAPSTSVLELIITPAILDKYDKIFQFLLILMRMHRLSQGLLFKRVRKSSSRMNPSCHSFCVELHHLTRTFLDFALNEAIQAPWQTFLEHIKTIASHLRKGQYEETMQLAGSVAQIRRRHQECLDEMLRTLLLKKKQAKVYGELCDLLTLGLQFANQESNQVSCNMYEAFKEGLISWLRRVEATATTSQDLPIQRLQSLVNKLDMSGYYRQSDT